MRRLAAPVCALALLASGCRFWYKPVPVANAIGEEQAVLAGDTMHVHRAGRFEVYGPGSEAVYDGYEQLNRAYRSFDRYFGGPSTRLALILYRDSVPALDSATARDFRARGFAALQYARARGMRTRTRYGYPDYGGVLWPVAPVAARHLLAEFARGQTGLAAASDSALLARFPLWYRAAVMRLVGDARTSGNDLERVRDKRAALIPLRDLLSMMRPPSSDTLIDPSRADDADDYTRTFAAQAGLFMRYLVEEEGAAVVGHLARGYVAGRPFNDAMAQFRSVPTSLPELERRWLVWIDTREE